MDYTAVKVVTEVSAVDTGEYKLYEPSVEKDMLDKDVTIKKLVGSYRLDRLEQEKTQYQANIVDTEAHISDIDAKIAAIKILAAK